jgi:hypothetical protein
MVLIVDVMVVLAVVTADSRLIAGVIEVDGHLTVETVDITVIIVALLIATVATVMIMDGMVVVTAAMTMLTIVAVTMLMIAAMTVATDVVMLMTGLVVMVVKIADVMPQITSLEHSTSILLMTSTMSVISSI